MKNEIQEVSVRWSDGYIEEFDVSEVRAGCDLLWMTLVNGKNRHIPLRTVRWFSITPKQELKSCVNSNAKSNGHSPNHGSTCGSDSGSNTGGNSSHGAT